MLSAILLGAFVYFATPTPACGPFFPSAIFTYTQHPDFPLIAFARGQLGILQPTYYRAYLFAAYRNLSGAPLSKKEQVAALSLWRERMTANWHPGQRPQEVAKATSPWLEARKQVPGTGAVTGLDGADPIGITRPTGQYSTYYNCLTDAFATARLTLQARIAKFGAGSTEVKEWLAAQDQVFANCSKPGGNSATIVPAAAHPEDNPLVRSDRAYQTAAAYFYNEEFPKAESLFAEIAKDKNSEWTSVARLLIARIYIREATLSDSEKPGDIDLAPLAKAEAQLQGLLADKNVAERHPAAQRLLGFVEFRLHPQERLAQLERALTHRDASADFEQDLCDYTWLLARNSTEREKNEAADWIFTFQGPPGEFVADHSVERWQQAKTLPWLIAAIANIPATHPQAGAILAAAAKVGPDSPAFATISFHRARLLAESNQNVAVRAELDALLEKQSSRFPPSSRNLLLAESRRISRNF
jgi:hypothetical protein